MNYTLSQSKPTDIPEAKPAGASLQEFWPLLNQERKTLSWAIFAVAANAGLSVLAPFVVGYTIDTFIATKDYRGVLIYSGILLLIYLVSLVAAYQQVLLMGSVGQRVLYRLRERIFNHLQNLPLAFFNANKAGDLISRINNDTNKLSQFLSETLVRLFGSLFIMAGAAIFMAVLDWRLGLISLGPVLLIILFTRLMTPWVRGTNADSLKKQGSLSAHIQESLSQFKVIVAFNRRDYFRERFDSINDLNYDSAVKAGVANQLFSPVYDFVYQLARLALLVYGVYLVAQGQTTVGLLIAYFSYLSRFYEPLRQIASLWASFQLAIASWERVQEILAISADRPQLATQPEPLCSELLCFEDVSFGYGSTPVLQKVSFRLDRGKTYAFVGPTGGGKSTTAALMARLYDPDSGRVLFQGQDLRSLTIEERAQKIGFILQEPFLFSGSLQDNLLYGHPQLQGFSAEALTLELKDLHLDALLERFEQGLETKISSEAEGISLGQKQMIAFMRAVLRRPALLILDEATANIDTVTEQLLDKILSFLPAETTRVIIAHRLNTIEQADAILFVNAGTVIEAGSLENAVNMLKDQQRQS